MRVATLLTPDITTVCINLCLVKGKFVRGRVKRVPLSQIHIGDRSVSGIKKIRFQRVRNKDTPDSDFN